MARELGDYGERRMRAAIGALPDGVAEFTDHMEWHGELVPITARVTVE